MSPLDIARVLIRLVLDLLPHDQAKQVLDEEAVKRANVVADAAEDVKFGP